MTSAPPSPLPQRIKRRSAHECAHKGIEVLLEDVHQTRKRRWWLTTVVVMALVAALGSLFAMAFDTGQRVGEAQRDLTYLQRAEEADRRAIKVNATELRARERESAVRDREIQEILTRLDARLERIEEAVRQRAKRR